MAEGAEEKRSAVAQIEIHSEDRHLARRPDSSGRKRPKRALLAEAWELPVVPERQGIAAKRVSWRDDSSRIYAGKALTNFCARSIIQCSRRQGSDVALTLGRDMDFQNWQRPP